MGTQLVSAFARKKQSHPWLNNYVGALKILLPGSRPAAAIAADNFSPECSNNKRLAHAGLSHLFSWQLLQKVWLH